MKNLCIALFVTALVAVGCDDKKKDLKAQFDTLMTESDSIEGNHQEFEKIHNKMKAEHQKFTQKLDSMPVQDSTALEDMAKHEVILKSHDAILGGHAELIGGHNELKSEFDQASDVEMQAQIDQIKKDHDKMMREHITMQDEHETIMAEHQDIENRLAETMEK